MNWLSLKLIGWRLKYLTIIKKIKVKFNIKPKVRRKWNVWSVQEQKVLHSLVQNVKKAIEQFQLIKQKQSCNHKQPNRGLRRLNYHVNRSMEYKRPKTANKFLSNTRFVCCGYHGYKVTCISTLENKNISTFRGGVVYFWLVI